MNPIPNPSGKPSRGLRISQVVADARASLEEPTRPFTPQGLDERVNSNTMKTISSSQITRGSNQFMNIKSKVAIGTNSGNLPSSAPTHSSSSNVVNRTKSPSPNILTSTLSSTSDNIMITENNINDLYANLRETALSKGNNTPTTTTSTPSTSNNPSSANSSFKENSQPKQSQSQSRSSNSNSNSQGKLLLKDLCEFLLMIEVQYNGKKEISEKEFFRCLINLRLLTEKLMKLFKNRECSFVPNDLLQLQAHFFEVVTQITFTDLRNSYKASFLAIVLKFCINMFQSSEIIDYHNNITLKTIELVVTKIYNLRISAMNSPGVIRSSLEAESVTDSGAFPFRKQLSNSIASQAYSPRYDEEEGRDEDIIDDDENDVNGDFSAGDESLNTNAFNLVETLIEALQFTWNTLIYFIKYEVDHVKQSYKNNHVPSSKTRQTQNNNNNNNPREEYQQSSSKEYKRAIFHLFNKSYVISNGFNIAAFLTATLKTYTNEENDRKRLLYCNIIEVMMNGMTIYEQSSYVHKIIAYPTLVKREEVIIGKLSRSNSEKKGRSRNQSAGSQKSRSNGDEEEEGGEDDDDDLDLPEDRIILDIYPPEEVMNLSIDKILASLTQMIGMIRNFSIDKTSRNQLLQSQLLKKFLVILSKYSYYSEIILNIARVLAKLSLYEGFRAEITNHLHYLKILMDIIQKESDHCRKIMENQQMIGGEGEEEEEEEGKSSSNRRKTRDDVNEWPSWYTWPMISRISFTLGNLTTTNESNRKLLGTDFNGMPSILLLLQVCASSLSRIHQQKQQQLEMQCDNLSMNPYVSLDEDDEEEAAAATRKTKKSKHKSSKHQRTGRSSHYKGDDSEEDEDAARYQSDEENGKEENDDDEEGEGEYEIDHAAEVELRDATIKLIRLLANISIDSNIGMEVGAKYDNLQTLLELLIICDQSIEQEEMLLNVVAAMTNLTYYSCQYINSIKTGPSPPSQSITSSSSASLVATAETRNQLKLEKCLITISTQLSNSLFHENAEIVLETLRVLGNLTRIPRVIETLIEQRIEEAFLILLQHTNSSILSAVIGIFINFTANVIGREKLLERDLHLHLLQQFNFILRKLTLNDMFIGTLISQALYNIYTSNEFKAIPRPVASKQMIHTLEELLEIVQEEGDGVAAANNHHRSADKGEDDKKEEEGEEREREGAVNHFLQFQKVTNSILKILKESPTIEYV